MKVRLSRFEPISLATNDPEKEMSLFEMDLLGDCLQARLRVRSDGFAVDKAFRVDDISVIARGLRNMFLKLEGEVRLGAAYEDDEVVLAMNDRGQLFVSGRLVSYGEGTHRLEFQFQTDQTALGPFVQALETFLGSAE